MTTIGVSFKWNTFLDSGVVLGIAVLQNERSVAVEKRSCAASCRSLVSSGKLSFVI